MVSSADTHFLAAKEWEARINRIEADIRYLEIVHGNLVEEKESLDPTFYKSQEKRIFRAVRRNKSDKRFAEKQYVKVMRRFEKAKIREDHTWVRIPRKSE